MNLRKLRTALAKRARIAAWCAGAPWRRGRVTGDAPAVVSLTSYGHRIATVFATIESIAAGDRRPQRVILWLAHDDLAAGLPRTLRHLRRRGLEIRGCADLGAHKKYYPYAVAFPDAEVPLITGDDDVLYPRTWLSELLARHERHPGCTVGYRGERMKFADDGSVAPYRTWRLAHDDRPDARLVLNGVGGVLYPPAVLAEVRRCGTTFLTEAPRGDDLWLHRATIRAGLLPCQLRPDPVHHPAVPGSQRTALMTENVETGNDIQVRSTYRPHDLDLIRAGGGA